MDRLVSVDVEELELRFQKGHRCSARFGVRNLMHTMSVAIYISITPAASASAFSLKPSTVAVIPPLSSAPLQISIVDPLDRLSLSSPQSKLLVRSCMLPTGRANEQELHQLFSFPASSYIFKDAIIPISFTGHDVLASLLNNSHCYHLNPVLIARAISACTPAETASLLEKAVSSGHSDVVRSLLQCSGGNDSLKLDPSTSASLLHTAASFGQVGILSALLQASMGASAESLLNSPDSYGRTPVHACALAGHLDALRFCISSGGDAMCADSSGWTPLHCSASEGHLPVVEFLLSDAVSSTKYALTCDGRTPFMLARDAGHRHLLDALHLGDALQKAAAQGDVQGIEKCLSQGATVDGRDQHGWTPLHRAAFKGCLDSVRLLLDHGARVDSVDDCGYTPLHCAAEAGHALIAHHLIKHGAPVNAKSVNGVRPLHLASCLKRLGMASLLQERNQAT
ncbi:hypothetical protein AMTRI_Chr12g275600 [Amborella trichopoda]